MTVAQRNIFNAIKGVILDVDGTLYYHRPVRLMAAAMMAAHGVVRPASTLAAVKTVLAWRKTLETLRRQSAGFDVGPRQLESTAAAVNLHPQQVRQIIQKWMFDSPLGYLRWFRRKGLVEFLRSAKERGLVLGAYSDYPCRKKLQCLGVLDYFSSVLSSWDPQVRSLKPDVRGFQVSCDALGIQPSVAMYIGDRLDVDGVGARNSGMRSVLIASGRPGIDYRSGHYWTDTFATLENQLVGNT